MHDLAFLHDPSRFSRQGLRVMRRSLDVTRDRAAMVITSSEASRRDLEANGVEAARIRVVPLGVDHAPASSDDVAAVRERYGLPERFVLFVGTLEPRKNLRRLAAATGQLEPMPLVVAGPDGLGRRHRWASTATCGSSASCPPPTCRRCTPRRPCSPTRASRRASACRSLEAMAQGTPVVTSAGTSTEEVAGGAAVLVDPFDVDAIAAGLVDAERRARRAVSRRPRPAGDDDVGGGGRAHARRLPRGSARARTRASERQRASGSNGLRGRERMKSASTCCGACRARVGGSEEYLARQLVGLHDVAPEIHATVFVLPGFAAAHREVAARHELVVASLDARRRSRRVLTEATWLPGRTGRRRRRPPRRRHGSRRARRDRSC